MIALKLLPIVQVVVILCSPTYSYPAAIYGTKRYGRLQRANSPAWTSAYQPSLIRSQRYPIGYYYPSQTYPDYFYHEPMSYPLYYPRTSKYEVYQAVLPYYYDRPPYSSLGYYGYDEEPIGDLQDEMDVERKQREDAQPIGQETYFEDESSESDDYSDVNAAFLQNLIMSQMYNKQDPYGYDSAEADEIYGKLDEFAPNKPNYYEDEEVLELKQLAKPYEKPKNKNLLNAEERLRWFQKGSSNDDKKRSVDGKLEWFTDRDDRKATVASPTSSTTSTSAPNRLSARGQKEEVLPRPATPVKHPFSVSALEVMYKKNKDREQREPSVYDTIKHMLDMEKNLEKQEAKPAMRKRIISSEDSLAKQLSVLKKPIAK